MRRRLFATLTLATVATLASLASLAVLGGCSPKDRQGERPRVVVTTTLLEDLAVQLAGDLVDLRTLVGVGVDPHEYQPVPSDARAIASAQLVLTHGLGLEGWVDRLVSQAGRGVRHVVVSQGMQPLYDPRERVPDPHVWMDVGLWRQAVGRVEEGLVDLFGSESAEGAIIRARATRYTTLLTGLDAWVRERMATIPEGQRVLVTSHDAFRYFGEAYAIPVASVLGVSTEQEASQRDVIEVIALVRERAVPVVFSESTLSDALLRQVARETGARLAGPLWSDSLGPPGGPAETYVAMVMENVRQIVEGLGGHYAPFPFASPRRGPLALPDGPPS